jgi:hypothetical protein
MCRSAKPPKRLPRATDLESSVGNFRDWQNAERTWNGSRPIASRFQHHRVRFARAILGCDGHLGFLRDVGTPPRLGRAFLESEDVPNPPKIVIVNDRIWRQRLGGRPDAIGKTLQISGQAYTVVGVLPPEYEFPGVIPSGTSIDLRTVEMYTPLQSEPLRSRGTTTT